jgi:hypothetical protein
MKYRVVIRCLKFCTFKTNTKAYITAHGEWKVIKAHRRFQRVSVQA